MLKKRLNGKLPLRLSLTLALLAAVTRLVHGYQNERHAHTLLAQARQAEQQGELDRATNYLQRYLTFAPGDTDALDHCGRLLEQRAVTSHDRERIQAIYQQVLAREPSRCGTRRRLAAQAMGMGLFLDARVHLEVLLQAQPAQADVEALLGTCLEAIGEPERAATLYEQSLAHDSTQRDVYLRLARLLQGTLDRPQQAAAVMDRLVEALSDKVDAHLERARYRMGQGTYEEAADDMARARELAPDDVRVLLAAADLAMRRCRQDEARTCLLRLCARYPEHSAAHLALADLEVRHSRLNVAADVLRQGLAAVPDQPDLLAALAEVHLDRDDFAAAGMVIERLRRPGVPAGLADLLDGEARLRHRDWTGSLRALEGVIDKGEAPAALAARAAVAAAHCHEHLGDTDRQQATLRRAVELDPALGPAHLALAAALEAAGNLDGALEQYRQAAALPQPPDGTWVALARALTRRCQALPARVRSWDEVEHLLDRADRLSSQASAAAVARAEAWLAQDQPAQARQVLEMACAQHPHCLEPWVAWAALASRQGDASAGRILIEARQRLGDRLELRLAQADLALLCGRRAAETALRELEKGLQGFSAEEQERLLFRAASVWFQLGQMAEGHRLTRLLAERPGLDLVGRVRLLDLALQGGDDELTTRLVADLRRLEGEEGTWWRYGEAARLVARAQRGDRAGLPAAVTRLEELQKRRSQWARVPLLRAYLSELAGDKSKAMDDYRRAFDLGERQSGVTQRLAQGLAERGRDAEAEEVLRRQEQAEPLSGRLARLAADVALRLHDGERAVEMARRAVAAEDQDYRDQVWLGQVLAVAGRGGEAEEALRRAVRLGADQPETWLALVAHLSHCGQDADAERVLEEACRKLPADLVPLTQAVAHEALARFGQAEKDYQEALHQQPEDGLTLQRVASFFVRLDRSREAIPLLRRLLDRAVQVPEANRVWARRQLALALASCEDDGSYTEARALLGADLALGDDPTVQRIRDFVAASRSQGRAEALRRLKATWTALPSTADQRFRLAKLYEAAGNADKARETILEALTLDMQNPEYLAYHIEHLLRAGHPDEARPWLARLEKLEPDSQRVQAFRKGLAAEP